jgi:hypothetical protein
MVHDECLVLDVGVMSVFLEQVEGIGSVGPLPSAKGGRRRDDGTEQVEIDRDPPSSVEIGQPGQCRCCCWRRDSGGC